MATGWNDVKRGPLLNEMYQNYKQWQDRPISDRYANVGLGAARSPIVLVALDPFTLTMTTNVLVKTNSRNQTKMGSAVGARVDTTPASEDLPVKGFRPATIIMKEKSGSGVRAVSNITGRPYKKYPGGTYRHPFGKTGTELEYEGFSAIRTALASSTRTFSFVAERFPV